MAQAPDADHQAGCCAGDGASRRVACDASPPADVLVVEDDREINELVGAYIQLAGFQYRSAETGKSALDEIHRRLPSLIVLDLMLPDLSGLEVCRRVKSEPATCGVPVVILTALDHEGTRRQSLACGATEYLTKPFDPDELMQAICRCAKQAV